MNSRHAEPSDFLVIGAGVVGLTVALELQRRHPTASMIVIDKEEALGAHSSGRNSGVLHAGFYYTPDSLKAMLTRDGNLEWRRYCAARGLRMNRCGKLVLAGDESEIEGLHELQRRGRDNGVELEWISEREARDIEPRAKTCVAALWSPTTASVDPKEIMASLGRDATRCGISVRLREPFRSYDQTSGITYSDRNAYNAGHVINAGGLYADRIARAYGFSRNHRILPFKGLYLYVDPGHYHPTTNMYPVPNLDYPFLGVHFTITVDGKAKIGPTALPALWRENYSGTANFRPSELGEILARETELFVRNRFNFRALAVEEVKKCRRSYMAASAARMLEGVTNRMFREWGKPGIRAQLLNVETKTLEMDFRLEGDQRSSHVLNAVSPALTCALPFARLLADQIEGKLGKKGHYADSFA